MTVALASPLPVHVVQEARELVVELSVRDAPVNNQVLHREVNTDAQSDVNLSILAREHESSEDYLQEVRVFPLSLPLLRVSNQTGIDRR